MTRKLKEVVNELGLRLVFTGSLSKVPDNPYLKAKKMKFLSDDEVKSITGARFFFRFNHFEGDGWTVWESGNMDVTRASEIYERYIKAKGRLLWDSFQLYLNDVDGELYIVL